MREHRDALAGELSLGQMRRVELAWPVTDPALRQQIVDECLVAYLHDNRDAWTLNASGSYDRAAHPTDGIGAQDALMVRYGPAAPAAAVEQGAA